MERRQLSNVKKDHDSLQTSLYSPETTYNLGMCFWSILVTILLVETRFALLRSFFFFWAKVFTRRAVVLMACVSELYF